MQAANEEERSAARTAAQHAVDTATSWDYSASRSKLEDKLREGLDAASVSVEDDEFDRVVDQIIAYTEDSSQPKPTVQSATPKRAG